MNDVTSKVFSTGRRHINQKHLSVVKTIKTHVLLPLPFSQMKEKRKGKKKEISKAHLFSLLQLSHVNCTPNYHDVFLHCIALSLI